jgi:hypothetical protein
LKNAEDDEGRGILLYPDTVKKKTWYDGKNEKKQELMRLAAAEKELFKDLFDALDYSGAPQQSLCRAHMGLQLRFLLAHVS